MLLRPFPYMNGLIKLSMQCPRSRPRDSHASAVGILFALTTGQTC